MHSPPPTPSTRSNQHATRTTNIFQDAQVADATVSRKRNREQAGLITPRETPRKVDLNKNGKLLDVPAAKVLFPTTKRRKFEVFQDPRSPDPFTDDTKNPFAAQKRPAALPSRPSQSSQIPYTHHSADRQLRHVTPDRDTASMLALPDVPESHRRRTRSMKRTPSPHRPDGMTYIFRGKRVFRKYGSAEEAEAAEAVKPKKLFVKEMNAPKLSTAFDGDSSDQEGFDGLELSTYQDPSTPIPFTTSQPRVTARRLF
ncbi:protein of unknown function [Taphrina deformans PYCC 5710]|uniref:Uncharacterized protein n=1 Tax=Taphrina deformans (strain PYCC 5710 / ATCC 11124 / CBS 356.35 / IMI 108563 / JCM 9778 / NBRC 8474) TaxID=1097556 RepID=R4XDZ8_TAPDE|nr:protein of unknown function [Taphrina deformans PYCC 5710]|eukprot:CCG84091.1 protein of unknown function [Taphrina deformans PYCC 5710]